MYEYNRLISDRVLDNVDRMIENVPQPQMFGGKRERKYVLPGSTAYDFAEKSLAVQGRPDSNLWDDEGGNDEELGMGGKRPSKFWRDFGRGFETGLTKTLEMGLPLVMGAAGRKRGMHQTYNGGAVFEDGRSTPGMRKFGGKKANVGKAFKEIGKALKPVGRALKPVAKEVFHEVVLPAGKEMVKSYIKSKMSPGASAPVSASGRRGGKKANVGKAFKEIGKALKPVGRALKPVAKEIFHDVVLPAGKEMLKSYIQSKMSPGASAPVSASGRRHRKKPHYESDSDSESDEECYYGEGGALLMDHPDQFHSKHYPKALESYNPRPKRGGKRAPSARGAIVKQVMKERGLSLPEASKFVKAHGLY
jgi:hypothetical protein